MENNLF